MGRSNASFLAKFFQAESGEAYELRRTSVVFEKLCHRHVLSETHTDGQTPNDGLDDSLHAWDACERIFHALADQRRQAVLRLFVGCEVLACLVCSACVRVCGRGL
jgi:hypothetical protein